jgi:hypothetical protein
MERQQQGLPALYCTNPATVAARQHRARPATLVMVCTELRRGDTEERGGCSRNHLPLVLTFLSL